MKKVWKYIIISLLLLLGLACIGVLYLFFVPGSSLFNITYINYNIKKETAHYDPSAVSTIELSTRAYDVEILESEDDKISLKANSNSFGFVLEKNKGFDVNSRLVGSTLEITVYEPHGFVTRNVSSIQLYLPTSQAYNLKLENYKATTTIKDENIQINNLSYLSKKGTLKFAKGKVDGDISLNIGKGDVIFSDAVETAKNDVSLKLTSGLFKAENKDFGDISIESNERGVIKFGSCLNLRETQKTAGGQISAKTVMHAHITAGDTIISIESITNAANIDLSASGSVSIGNLSGESSISTNSGNIHLGKVLSPITLFSESGNINVDSATLQVTVTVNYGEASIDFDLNAPSYTSNTTEGARTLYATIKNGKLTATGVEHIGVASDSSQNISDGGIKITGNGRAYIKMQNIYGTNSILGNNGSVNVVINKDAEYILKTSTVGGSVRVNLTQISEFGGYRTKEARTTKVNCSSSSESLTVTTNYGDLTVLDTNFG